jgi:NADPH:quinone reductase-like Zn-dependent oxidoreductase
MRAIIRDPDTQQFRFTEKPDPVPTTGQVRVRVQAVSINYGEAKYAVANGAVPGWDAAGVIERTTAGAPPAGTRVVTFGRSGAWAQLRTVDVHELAVLPENVDVGTASALPVAGVTALRALRRLGDLRGRRVLITGASGGVGRFAVQLGRHLGAYVIAVVGSAARGEGLTELGAHEVVTDLHGIGEVDGVLDNVSGPLADSALERLAANGTLIAIGRASGQTMSAQPLPTQAIVSFNLGAGLADDLAYLLDLLAQGRLDAQVDWRGSWEQINDAVAALFARTIRGKAVLDVA